MKKKVLITGASGFVGYHLINEALRHDLDVFAAVRKSSRIDHLEALPLNFTTVDFEDAPQLEQNLKANQYNYIIHAAGITRALKPEDYNKVNAGYTRNLAEAVKRSGVPLEKFVLVSSLAAMGPLAKNQEDVSDPAPITSYGKSKLMAEKILEGFNFPAIIVRPTAVYGPREKDIFLLFKSIKSGLELYIGRECQHLSFIHANDLADAIMALLLSSYTKKTYNLTDGKVYDRYALSSIAKNLLGKKTFKMHLSVGATRRAAGIMEWIYALNGKIPALNREKLAELTALNWCYSIENIKRDIGFAPKYNLENGLKQTINWYKQNNWI